MGIVSWLARRKTRKMEKDILFMLAKTEKWLDEGISPAEHEFLLQSMENTEALLNIKIMEDSDMIPDMFRRIQVLKARLRGIH